MIIKTTISLIVMVLLIRTIATVHPDPMGMVLVALPLLTLVASLLIHLFIQRILLTTLIIFLSYLTATFTIFNNTFLIWVFAYTGIAYLGTIILENFQGKSLRPGLHNLAPLKLLTKSNRVCTLDSVTFVFNLKTWLIPVSLNPNCSDSKGTFPVSANLTGSQKCDIKKRSHPLRPLVSSKDSKLHAPHPQSNKERIEKSYQRYVPDS